jgi:hypothetical protein
VNLVSSVPGFGALPPQRIDASYDSKINNFSAGFNHSFTESFLAGADLNWFDNSGTFPSRPVDPFPLSAFGSFPLDWTQFQLWGQFKTTAGYLIRIAYQRNDYNEEIFTFDDYDANMVTVSVGYAF